MTFVKRIALLSLIIMSTCTSCYKVKEIFIMKGEWVVNSVELDGGKTNMMYTILPDYHTDNSRYVVYFGDEDRCTGQYYIDDNLNYAVEGTWALIDKHHIYIELDNYVKGVFELEEQSRTEMIMYAEQNIVKFYNIGEVEMILRVTRD